jgi:non-ribosomal peptide synthetase component F
MLTGVAALAVMKAGATSILLDSSLPTERLQVMLQQAKPITFICAALHLNMAHSLELHLPTITLDRRTVDETLSARSSLPLPISKSSDVAYAVFTSGNTVIGLLPVYVNKLTYF